MATADRATRFRGFALVGAGGAFGAVLRFALGGWVPGSPPLGTLAANALGAFLLGIVLYESHLAARLSTETRLLVGTGFCGSLTTYSTFAAETAALAPVTAAAYVTGTYATGALAVLLGRLIARWLS